MDMEDTKAAQLKEIQSQINNMGYLCPKQTKEEVISVIERIRGYSLRRHKAGDFDVEVSSLIHDSYLNLPLQLFPSTVLQRGRKLPEKQLAPTLNDLYNPAKQRMGRANRKDQAVIYSALTLPTVFAECGAETGTTIQVMNFSLKDEDPSFYFILIGQFHYFFKTGKSILHDDEHLKAINIFGSTLNNKDPEAWAKLNIIDAFFAKEFQKKVRREHEFKITSAIAGIFLSKDNIAGIIYPSVAWGASLNFAIKRKCFDDYFKVRSCHAYKITDYLGYGIYLWREYARSNEIDPTTKVISWEML